MAVRLAILQTVLGILLVGTLVGSANATSAANAPLTTQNFKFHNYSHDQGIVQNQILDIIQDKQGYIWLATHSGLLRYDGHAFTLYTTDDGLSSNAIETLGLDARGRLLVGTWGGGMCLQRKAGFVCVSEKAGLPSGIVHDFDVYNGRIIVATETGLASLHPETLAVTKLALPVQALKATNWILSLAVSADNTLWIGTNHGLLKTTPQGVQLAANTPFGKTAVTALFADKTSVYAGTGKGLYRWDKTGWQSVPLPAALESATISQVICDANNTLWISTDNGVLQLANSNLLTRSDGLPTNQINAMLQSRDGTFWFATDNGLSKLIITPFKSYSMGDGLPHNFVRALFERANGDVWIGTKSGVAIYNNGDIHKLNLPAPFNTEKIYALHSAPEGGMLIGTSEGLLHWQNSETTVFDETDDLPAAYVSSMVARPAGGIWIGTRSGLAYWQDGKIHPVNQPALNKRFILALAVDTHDRLWVASDHGGVVLYHNNEAQIIGKADGLSDQTIWALEATSGGAVWVGTNGNGAYRITHSKGKPTIEHFSRKNGLADNFVWQILHDSKGRTWFYTNNGLDQLWHHQITHYDRSHGLPSLEGNTGASLEHQSGLLFFGTTNGLVVYNPSSHTNEHPPVTVLVESVTTPKGGRTKPGETLPYDFQPLTIDYTSLVFRGASAVNYRYRLVGLSDDWVHTDQTTTTFGSLFPGHYVFEVTARMNEDNWTQPPVRFAFTVAAPFWLSGWFWALAIVLFILLAGGLYRLRINRLKRIQYKLQKKVRQRTRALEKSNRELQRLSFTDELTGLYNRRRFMDDLQVELQRMQRVPDKTWLGLLFVDVDHFKAVNDNFGHVTGDHVLAECSQRLQNTVRNTDVVARYGGEEFAIMLPFTSPAGAQQVAAKILYAFSVEEFSSDGQTLPLTVSIGIAVLQKRLGYSNENPDIENMFRRADQALYQAKANGRNRFDVAPPLFCNSEYHQQQNVI
ncbi:MAG TPA: diguanylate cyclase [Gammaproteobacteria bacterium]|nr:diguanylate cyclase [Gammaproteobacteria bacterium]